MKTKAIQFKCTQTDQKPSNNPHNPFGCPVQRCVERRLYGREVVISQRHAIVEGFPCRLPDPVIRNVHDLGEGKMVAPFEFVLHIPLEVFKT